MADIFTTTDIQDNWQHAQVEDWPKFSDGFW